MMLEVFFGLSMIQTIHIEDSVSFSAKKEIKSFHPIEVDGRVVEAAVEDRLVFTNFDVSFVDYFKDAKRDFATKEELTKYAEDVLCKVQIQSWKEVSIPVNMNSRSLKSSLNPWILEISQPKSVDMISLEISNSESPWSQRYWTVGCSLLK